MSRNSEKCSSKALFDLLAPGRTPSDRRPGADYAFYHARIGAIRAFSAKRRSHPVRNKMLALFCQAGVTEEEIVVPERVSRVEYRVSRTLVEEEQQGNFILPGSL